MTKRRRFRFGVKAMFGVFVLLAVLLWWLRSPSAFTVHKFAHWAASSRLNDGTTYLIVISWHENPISHKLAYLRDAAFPEVIHFYHFDQPEHPLKEAGVEHDVVLFPSEEFEAFRTKFALNSHRYEDIETLFWESGWGDPIATMNAFTSDEPVEEWTSESFLKWIAAGEARAK